MNTRVYILTKNMLPYMTLISGNYKYEEYKSEVEMLEAYSRLSDDDAVETHALVYHVGTRIQDYCTGVDYDVLR